MTTSGMDQVGIRISSIAGECQAGHYVGEKILIDNVTLSGYLCPHALHSLWPYVITLQMGGKFTWGDGDCTDIACPDAQNRVIFNVYRIREESE